MVPGSGVVAGPGCRIALRACESCAREHEGPHIRLEFEEAVVGGVHVSHAEDVVNLAMIGLPVIDVVNCVERHCFRRRHEHRRLVHVIPEAPHPILYELGI